MLLTGAGGGASNVLASVPWVAQWKFNNNGNDSIGANNLTNTNSATFTTGKLGGATGATQLVAASSQYWSIADNAALSMGDVDFTICAWVYADSRPAADGIVSKSTSGGLNVNTEYTIGCQTVPNHFAFFVGDGTTLGQVSSTSFGGPAVATWYCVIAWHDSVNDTLNIQINDGTIDSVAWTTGCPDRTGAFNIGRRYNGGQYWDGRIDNLCIAKSAAGGGGVLTAAQRTAFFNAGVGTETLT